VQIKADLERILEFCEQLNGLDTTDVEPLIYMSDRTDHLREDVVKPSLDKKRALGNAPSADSDYYKVPKVINK
jgi:aspartyl-tRNA(Asn)/glutamyl-tRNA(Gln) amidotransferase subunit C